MSVRLSGSAGMRPVCSGATKASFSSMPTSRLNEFQPAEVRPFSKDLAPLPKLIIFTVPSEAKWNASPRSSPWTISWPWCNISRHSVAPTAKSRKVRSGTPASGCGVDDRQLFSAPVNRYQFGPKVTRSLRKLGPGEGNVSSATGSLETYADLTWRFKYAGYKRLLSRF